MQQYRVGQILFLIADASKVVPIQVVEEVIRTTLEGKEKRGGGGGLRFCELGGQKRDVANTRSLTRSYGRLECHLSRG